MSERYYQLQSETEEKFQEIVSSLAFPTKINFKLIGDVKQKKLIVVKKVSDMYAYLSGHQILVTINEPLFDSLMEDGQAVELLFVDELNNIQINMESGAIKIGKPNFITCVSVLEKYSTDEVKRVKDLERLTLEQADEKKQEEAAADPNGTY